MRLDDKPFRFSHSAGVATDVHNENSILAMKTKGAVLILLLAFYSATAAERKLVWADEFDKAGAPDPAKWAYEQDWLRNNEAQYYTRARAENARIENGCLVIESRKEKFLMDYIRIYQKP